jgi:hypothetical protein
MTGEKKSDVSARKLSIIGSQRLAATEILRIQIDNTDTTVPATPALQYYCTISVSVRRQRSLPYAGEVNSEIVRLLGKHRAGRGR